MDKQQLEVFRQRLLNMRTDLESLADTSKEATKTVVLDQSSVGRLSRMDAMQGQQMALEAARRREQELQGIAGALRRIESGDFGICYVCDEEIPVQRLEANPSVTRCIQCADK